MSLRGVRLVCETVRRLFLNAEFKDKYLLSNGTLVVVCDLVGSVFEMDVDALFADVDFAVGEPAVEMEVIHAEDSRRKGMPMNMLGLVFPVTDGVLEGEGKRGLI